MEARRLRKVISKMRDMIEDKAEDLRKVVGENFSKGDATCCNDFNRALLEVEAIAESLIQISLDTKQYGDVPGQSEDTKEDDVDADDSDLHPTQYGDYPDLVKSVVDSPESGGGSDWSIESDRSWHLRYV